MDLLWIALFFALLRLVIPVQHFAPLGYAPLIFLTVSYVYWRFRKPKLET